MRSLEGGAEKGMQIARGAAAPLSVLSLVLSACGGPEARRPEGPVVVDVARTPPVDAAAALPEDAGARPEHAPRDHEDLAKRLFREGRQHFDAGEYELALERFEAAYKASPKVELLYDIGRTLELMGRKSDAADVYERYTRQADLTYIDRSSMELRIKQLRSP